MDDELEDLAWLRGLAGGSRASSSSEPAHQRLQPQLVAAAAAAALARGAGDGGGLADEVEDIRAMQVVVAAPARQKFQRRSWEHIQHARSEKKRKLLAKENEALKQNDTNLRRGLALVASDCPAVRNSLGVERSMQIVLKENGDEMKVQMVMHQAMLPVQQGAAKHMTSKQARAMSRFVDCIMDCEQVYADDKVFEPVACEPNLRIVGLSYQWDETLQSMRSPDKAKTVNRSSPSSSRERVQTMVQTGQMYIFEFPGGLAAHPEVVSAPWLVRPLFLWRQTANYLLEGLLRSLPISLESIVKMRAMAASAEVVILSLSRDGATANTNVCEWIFFTIEKLQLPNIFVFSHLCSLHRVAIARSRVKMVQAIVNALSSFTRWLRVGKNSGALVDALSFVISRDLRIERRARPVEFEHNADRFVEFLYKHGGDEFMWTTTAKGERKRTGFHDDLLDYMSTIDLGTAEQLAANGGQFQLTHWCFVTADSDDHRLRGKAVGSRCCTSRSESVDKVSAPIVKFMVTRAWPQMCVSRWTHTPTTAKRALVCSLGPRILPKALDHIRTSWEVSDGLEAMLARAIAIDHDDFASQNKLRLLRFCRAMCHEEMPMDLMVSCLSTVAVDNIMYKLMGHGGQSRATILSLMQPGASPITKALVDLCGLLRNWSGDATSHWFVLPSLGVELANPDIRLKARTQLLQCAAGVFDCFEVRFARPPYSLAALAMEVDNSVKEEVCKSFEDEPDGCLPSGCLALRRLCPTKADLIFGRGPGIIHAWAESTFLCIDDSERSHAQMRSDLNGPASGRSPTVSANKFLLRKVRSAHVHRGGSCCFAKCIGDGLHKAGDNTKKPTGSNPKMEHHNSKRQAFKSLHSPGRPMTPEQRQRCEDEAKSDWQRILADESDEYDMWRLMHLAGNSRRKAAIVALQDDDMRSGPFQGLWGGGTIPENLIVPVATMIQHDLHKGVGKEAEAKTWHDERLMLKEQPRDRMSDLAGRDVCIDGCLGDRRNVCRQHKLGEDEAAALTLLTTRLYRFVDTLSKQEVESADILLRFVGKHAENDTDEDAITMLFLLVDARFSPKVQSLARCHMTDESTINFANVPFDIMIGQRRCRIPGSSGAQVIDIVTSDEACYEMVAKRSWWAFGKVQHHIKVEVDSLLYMVVDGVDPLQPVVAPAKLKKKATASAADRFLPPELDVEDPLSSSSSRGSAAGKGPLSGTDLAGTVHVPVDPEVDHADDVLHNLANGDEAMEAELAAAEADVHGSIDPEDIKAAEDLAKVVASASGGTEGDDSDKEDGEEEEENSEGAALVSLFEAVRACTVSPMGYVTCDIEPYKSLLSPLARITTWPASKPLASRSVSIRCYRHPGCSFAKTRWSITDNDLLCWLFSGDLTAAGSRDFLKEKGIAHMAKGRAGTFPRMDAASSSS